MARIIRTFMRVCKMEFNEKHKVIIDTMNEDEARAFVKFLDSEIIRHYGDIEQAKKLRFIVDSKLSMGDFKK